MTDENEKMLEDAGIKCIYLELSKLIKLRMK